MLRPAVKNLGTIVVMAFASWTVAAQQAVQPVFHEKPECMWSGDEMFLAATVTADGEARAYYRVQGAVDWCYVVGDRLADRAFFVLPQFSEGVTIQYFFLSQVNDIVTARSDRIYEVVLDAECRRQPPRHEEIIISSCEESGGIGTAVGAALQMETDSSLTEPSPFTPGS